MDVPDPSELAERFREGGLAGLVQNDEQRDVMERMQAAMAVVEGHAEHVMDALAPELVPHHRGLRAAMDARRESRSAPERVLMRLLGMEMKMRQYKIGKEFCDAVVADAGIEGLNRVWAGPEALPTLAELERPADWLARQAPDGGRIATG
jgi:putative hydrolase